ncbi:MAG: LexA family transcriptional regulator [Chryseobacterium sp.]
MNDITIRFLKVYNYLSSLGKTTSSADFAKIIDISSSMMNEILKGRSNAGINPIQKTVNEFPEINAEWLLTGKGEMLKTKSEKIVIKKNDNKNDNLFDNKPNVQKKLPFESNILSIAEPHSEYGKVMRKLKFAEGINIADNGAPFYDLPVSAGKVDELLDIEENPSGFLSLPGINCDAYFPIMGCSFEPFIRRGDIIGINFINRWENLDPDCIYLIILYDQRMMKRLMSHPTDDTLLICISPNLKEFNIDKFTIRYIHKVTFCGRPV